MIKKLKNNNGLTLIEVLVSVAILTVMMTAAYSFFSFSNQSSQRGVDQFSIQGTVRTASDYITNQIRYSSEIEILSSMDPSIISNPLNEMDAYENYIFYLNGQLTRIDRYTKTSFYIGNEGDLAFTSIDGGRALNFDISGIDNTQNFSIESEVKPLNLELEEKGIDGASGQAIRYVTANDYLAKKELPIVLDFFSNDSKAVQINFSKGVLDVVITEDNKDDSNSPQAEVDIIATHDIEFTFGGESAGAEREIKFTITFDDDDQYDYRLFWDGNWVLEGQGTFID